MRKRKFIITAKPWFEPKEFQIIVWTTSRREAINSFLFGEYQEDFKLIDIVRCNASKYPGIRNFKCSIIKAWRNFTYEPNQPIMPQYKVKLLENAYENLKQENNKLLLHNYKLMGEIEKIKSTSHVQY